MKKNGFSLIELLVVMFIIGILTSVLLPNLMGARQKAKDAQRMTDMDSLKGALRLYYNDNQNYPDPVGGMVDPTDLSDYFPGVGQIGVGYTYEYSVSNNNDSFLLRLRLESAAGDEDTNSQVKCNIGVGSTEDGWYAVCAN